MTIIILGGGIAGLSLAHFLNEDTIILEKEEKIGGLCRSFEINNIWYDIGPHILFSKNKDILNWHTSIIETNILRRSNKISHKGKFVKYPFENDLAMLDENEKEYCLNEFLNNPYEKYCANNMLQFFLKTFGEGITRLYLQPYNEKIWKYDPSFLDLQMVERIPKPPREDVIKSAKGIPTEGYLHQLYFHYPKKGGIQSLVNAYIELVKGKAKIINPIDIKTISKKEKGWIVKTNMGNFTGERLVNCMPLHELFKYIEAPDEVRNKIKELKYNSIYIVIIQVRKDNLGDNFAINIADKDIIFHRITKLNFLGENYCLKEGGTTLLAEITYRDGSYLAQLSIDRIKEKVIHDTEKLGFISAEDVIEIDLKSFKYAYVIYDLNHKNNTSYILNYLLSRGIYCNGRFAEFEYMNTDIVVEHSQKLAKRLNEEKNEQED